MRCTSIDNYHYYLILIKNSKMHFYIDSVEESCQNKAGMKAMIEYLIDFELK